MTVFLTACGGGGNGSGGSTGGGAGGGTGGNPPSSPASFEKAVELNPNDETMMGNLADGYRAAGQMDKANATYDKAIALAFKDLRVNPRRAETMGDLSLYFAKKGDVGQAMEFMKRARELDPSSVDLILNSAEVHVLSKRRKRTANQVACLGCGHAMPVYLDTGVRFRHFRAQGSNAWQARP
jgi:Tfp pilus assembly protein PilF